MVRPVWDAEGPDGGPSDASGPVSRLSRDAGGRAAPGVGGTKSSRMMCHPSYYPVPRRRREKNGKEWAGP